MPLSLESPISSLPLIGPKYASKLQKLEIHTVRDLLHHYPARYLDRSSFTPISSLDQFLDQPATIVAQIIDFKNIFTKTGKNLQKAIVADASGQLEITWFNQRFLAQSLVPGLTFSFSGKVKLFRSNLSLQAPEFELIKTNSDSVHTGRLVPVYPETAGVSSKWLRSRLKLALENIVIYDYLPQDIRDSHQLLDLRPALEQIHFPDSTVSLERAKKRLAFDELFLLQLEGAIKRQFWHTQHTKNHLNLTKDTQAFIKSLPFQLTSAQIKASDEILSDLKLNRPMNRLLEGDVGSGKTVVAAIAMHAVHYNGFQSVLMAPTEILAGQHFQELRKLLSPHGISVGLYTGSTKAKAQHDVLVGTHALLYNLHTNKNLALIVIDEQHRFGVQQRATLEKLGSNPHRLTMSATPIPRTIALTLYGDLDVSIIDQMPLARLPVKTWVIPHAKRQKAYAWIDQQIQAYHSQAFVVCPFVDPSDAPELTHVRSATQEFSHLLDVFPQYNLDLLHGRLSSTDKQAALSRFKAGQTHILVSTPVIEVGIDVPNATIMLIEAAERFGLAQLHQLRGRVGRGDKQSYCLLFSSTDNKTENRRLQALTRYNSGFKLAEIDLKLRGPGEVFGLSQHGFSQLKLAKLSDKTLLDQTRVAATSLIATDPSLQVHPQLAALVNQVSSEIAGN